MVLRVGLNLPSLLLGGIQPPFPPIRRDIGRLLSNFLLLEAEKKASRGRKEKDCFKYKNLMSKGFSDIEIEQILNVKFQIISHLTIVSKTLFID